MPMDGAIPYAMLMGLKAEVDNMGSGLTPKGVVASTSDLPATGEVGDMYIVAGDGYATYIWDDLNSTWAKKLNDAATVQEYLNALYT